MYLIRERGSQKTQDMEKFELKATEMECIKWSKNGDRRKDRVKFFTFLLEADLCHNHLTRKKKIPGLGYYYILSVLSPVTFFDTQTTYIIALQGYFC